MSSTDTRPAGGGCPVHHGFQPFEQADPFPAYARLRADEPVMYDERVGYWVVSRYDDVKAVFEDWETFSSENAQAPVRERGAEARSGSWRRAGSPPTRGLSARVPPDHTRIRKIVQKAFTPRRYKVLEPSIRAHVVRMVEDLLAHEDRRGDLVRDLAYDVPTVTILTLIGADTDEGRQFKTLVGLAGGHDVGRPHRRAAGAARPPPGGLLAGVPAARHVGARDPPRQPGRRPRPGPGRGRADHRPRDRLDLLLHALRRARDDHDPDLQHAAGPARPPRPVGPRPGRPAEGRTGHRRGAPLQPLDRGVAPQGVA